MHNSLKTIISIFLSLLVGAILGYGIGSHRQLTSTMNTNTNLASVAAGDVIVSTPLNSDEEKISSQYFHYSLTLPGTFSYASYGGNALSPGQLLSASFRSTNIDTSQTRNRNTPNGINPSSQNVIGLSIYPNSTHLNVSQETSFRSWLKQIAPFRSIEKLETISLNGEQLFATLEKDGDPGSQSFFYYFFGPQYIYAFGTSDFPDQAMREAYLARFSMN